MRLPALLATAALITLAPSAHALQGWDRTPTGVPMNASFGDQHRPVSLADGSGGAFLVWTDVRSGSYDLYANHITAAGTVLWGAGGKPICTAPGIQELPKLCSDAQSGFIVVWEDARGGNYDIYAQRVKATGDIVWATNGVPVCALAGDQYSPTVVADNTGGAIVAWTDFRAGNTSDIFAQRLNPDGVKLWNAAGIGVCVAPGDQDSPGIVTDNNGGAICLWSDYRNGIDSDIYSARITNAGTMPWGINGIAACVAAGDQITPTVCSDGAGGIIAAWTDMRYGNADVFAQRVTQAGVAMWNADGDSVSTAPGDQQNAVVEPDGLGGVYVAWEDARTGENDIYAMRINAIGQLIWFGDHGIPVCVAPGSQTEPRFARDGFGYVICLWQDTRSGSFDLYAQRLVGFGRPWWTVDGIPVCTASGQQVYPTMCSDLAGGAYVFWEDNRNGANDIYGQRVMAYGGGILGACEPVIRTLADVPGDDGGFVTMTFDATLFENPDYNIPIFGYEIMKLEPTGDVHVGFVPATGAASYSVVIPTDGDSVTVGTFPRTLYRINTIDTFQQVRWHSVPDSSYSIDNTPPPAVDQLTGLIVNNQVRLSWRRSPNTDVRGYRVYWGNSQSFVTDATTLRTTTTDTVLTDFLNPDRPYYKISVLDTHGNESEQAWVLTEATLDAPPARVAAAFLAQPSPNPSTGRTTLRFGLAHDARVQLDVYDQQGRRVRGIDAGALAAGEHVITWDGRDEAGHDSAPGLYFVRARLDGRDFTQRLVRVR
jgi:hypothetical protein